MEDEAKAQSETQNQKDEAEAQVSWLVTLDASGQTQGMLAPGMLVKIVSVDLGLVPPTCCQCVRTLPCLPVKKFLLVLCPGPAAFWTGSVLICGQV